jgi:hypothetical protein
VLERDSAGAAAGVAAYDDVSESCRLLRAALLLACGGGEEGGGGIKRADVEVACVMEGQDSFGQLVALALLNQVTGLHLA